MANNATPCVGLCLLCGAPGVGKSSILDHLPSCFDDPMAELSIIRFDEIYRELQSVYHCSIDPSEQMSAFSPEIWHTAQQVLLDRVSDELTRLYNCSMTTSRSSWMIVEDNFHLASMRKRFKLRFCDVMSENVASTNTDCEAGVCIAMCEVLVTAPPHIIFARNSSRAVAVPESVVNGVIMHLNSDTTWQHATALLNSGSDSEIRNVCGHFPVTAVLTNDNHDDVLLTSRMLKLLLRELSEKAGQPLIQVTFRAVHVAQRSPATFESLRHRIDLQLRSVVSIIMKSSTQGEAKEMQVRLAVAKKQILESVRSQTARNNDTISIWDDLNDAELHEMVRHLLSSSVSVL